MKRLRLGMPPTCSRDSGTRRARRTRPVRRQSVIGEQSKDSLCLAWDEQRGSIQQTLNKSRKCIRLAVLGFGNAGPIQKDLDKLAALIRKTQVEIVRVRTHSVAN